MPRRRPQEVLYRALPQWPDGKHHDCAYRARIALRERVLQKLQRPLPVQAAHGEIFYSPSEAQILIEPRRVHYNTVRPHSALRYRPPAPESILPIDKRPTTNQQSNRTTQWGPLKFEVHDERTCGKAQAASNLTTMPRLCSHVDRHAHTTPSTSPLRQYATVLDEPASRSRLL